MLRLARSRGRRTRRGGRVGRARRGAAYLRVEPVLQRRAVHRPVGRRSARCPANNGWLVVDGGAFDKGIMLSQLEGRRDLRKEAKAAADAKAMAHLRQPDLFEPLPHRGRRHPEGRGPRTAATRSRCRRNSGPRRIHQMPALNRRGGARCTVADPINEDAEELLEVRECRMMPRRRTAAARRRRRRGRRRAGDARRSARRRRARPSWSSRQSKPAGREEAEVDVDRPDLHEPRGCAPSSWVARGRRTTRLSLVIARDGDYWLQLEMRPADHRLHLAGARLLQRAEPDCLQMAADLAAFLFRPAE